MWKKFITNYYPYHTTQKISFAGIEKFSCSLKIYLHQPWKYTYSNHCAHTSIVINSCMQSSIISLFIFLTYGTWVFFYFSIQYSPSECLSLFTRCQYDGLFGQTNSRTTKRDETKAKNKTYLCKSINKILSIVQEKKLILNIIHRMCSNFANKQHNTKCRRRRRNNRKFAWNKSCRFSLSVMFE